jgi:hypothetical protein
MTGWNFMMNGFIFFVPLLLGLGIALCWVWRRMVAPVACLPVTANWIEDLSPERYRPMMRLLDPEDLEFLRSQPGFTTQMASKLRAQRCRIFRAYLLNLNQDFQRVILALKLILLHSSHDRPELARALVQQQAHFAFAMAAVHARLFLYRWDLCRVDGAALVRIFDSMRLELQALVPAANDLAA